MRIVFNNSIQIKKIYTKQIYTKKIYTKILDTYSKNYFDIFNSKSKCSFMNNT